MKLQDTSKNTRRKICQSETESKGGNKISQTGWKEAGKIEEVGAKGSAILCSLLL